ncbi:MAG: sugar transferase [Patescibacteria group bacterium]
MKKSQLILAALALPFDYIALILAGLAAYFLRFGSFIIELRPILFYLPLKEYLPLVLMAALVWLVFFAIAGLYQIHTRLKFYEELRRVFLACSTGLALIIILFFFDQALFSSRFIVLMSWLLAIIFVSVERWLLRVCRNAFFRKGIAQSNVLIIGSDSNTAALVKLFTHSPSLGYKVIANLAKFESFSVDNIILGVDEILVSDKTLTPADRLTIWEYCNEHHLGFKYVADIFNAELHNVVIHTWAGVPVVEIKKTPLDGWGKIAKRLFDIILAMILIIVFSPILAVIALIIRLVYGSPVIVNLERIGEKGEEFILHKYRSMIQGADKMKNELLQRNERADGPLFKLSNDPRVTPFGRFLRKWSFDELPQLVNVLAGQMSLVGPRPHEPQEVSHYAKHYKKLLNIKPGITGLAQISGRSSLSFEDEARLDSFYIENWSLGHDLLILIKTVYVVIRRKDAV